MSEHPEQTCLSGSGPTNTGKTRKKDAIDIADHDTGASEDTNGDSRMLFIALNSNY